MTCKVCGRELGTVRTSNHHIIPKAKKGKELVMLHDICHLKLHQTFTNNELENIPFDEICANEEIVKFVKWVAKKEITFYSKSDETKGCRKKRGR